MLFFGLGSMLGAGIYALVGRAAESLGNAVWLAFTAVMLTELSYACVGDRCAKAGGAAYVTQQALGNPAISYMVGIGVMTSGLTSMVTDSQAIAYALDGSREMTAAPGKCNAGCAEILQNLIREDVR